MMMMMMMMPVLSGGLDSGSFFFFCYLFSFLAFLLLPPVFIFSGLCFRFHSLSVSLSFSVSLFFSIFVCVSPAFFFSGSLSPSVFVLLLTFPLLVPCVFFSLFFLFSAVRGLFFFLLCLL
jgi:hypothetical protein